MVDFILFCFMVLIFVAGVYCGTTYGGIKDIAAKLKSKLKAALD